MKNRLIRSSILNKSRSSFGRIITLTGARQTGKTTLLKHEFKDYEYISFDDPVIRTQYLNMSAEQWYALYPKAILDEIQKSPGMIDIIKAVYDKYEDSQYILSGSSQINLMDSVKESLAGRSSIFELFSLTLPERLTESWDSEIGDSRFISWLKQESKSINVFQGVPVSNMTYCQAVKEFENYLQYGAMPVMCDNSVSEEDKKDWISDYISTYIQRDIRDIGNIKQLEPFVALQKMSASLTGEILNYNQLAKSCRINSRTVMKFLSYLSISYQVILLQPWFKNPSRRLMKSPKLHFLDPGVQRRLLFRTGELTGNEFESAVVSEIIRQLKSYKLDVQFYHLRTFDGREIDLLIELPEGFVAIEIKKSSNVDKNDARHLKNLSDILDKPLIHLFVLSNDNEIKYLTEQITMLPVVWFLSGDVCIV